MEVTLQRVAERQLAAVRRKVAIGQVGTAWRPALDQVWAFLRSHPGLHSGGHNVFVYHHPEHRGDPLDVDFGVEVLRAFAADGEVAPARTPAGEVATAVAGGYDRLRETHEAIHAFCEREHREKAGVSWEIYGDPDPDGVEITVSYLLKRQEVRAARSPAA